VAIAVERPDGLFKVVEDGAVSLRIGRSGLLEETVRVMQTSALTLQDRLAVVGDSVEEPVRIDVIAAPDWQALDQKLQEQLSHGLGHDAVSGHAAMVVSAEARGFVTFTSSAVAEAGLPRPPPPRRGGSLRTGRNRRSWCLPRMEIQP